MKIQNINMNNNKAILFLLVNEAKILKEADFCRSHKQQIDILEQYLIKQLKAKWWISRECCENDSV